jgi:hypothetical protein
MSKVRGDILRLFSSFRVMKRTGPCNISGTVDKTGGSTHVIVIVPPIAAKWNQFVNDSMHNLGTVNSIGDNTSRVQKHLSETMLNYLEEVDKLHTRNKNPLGIFNQISQEYKAATDASDDVKLHSLCAGSLLLVPSAGAGSSKNRSRIIGGIISNVAKTSFEEELIHSREV